MMVKNEENAIMLKDFDANLWAKTVEKLAKDKELRGKLGTAAHETIAEHFTWDALADKFIEVYKSLIDNYNKAISLNNKSI